jgi:hypothetical protein
MNPKSVLPFHWGELTNVVLPHAQKLRLKSPPQASGRASGEKLLVPQGTLDVLRRLVLSTFYALYEKSGGGYSENLPGEPDASWDRLVQLFLDNANVDTATPAAKARWVPDRNREKCNGCGKAFGTFTRKHHCRLCGEIFCDACTRKRTDIRNPLDDSTKGRAEGLQTNQRVCENCFDLSKRKTHDDYLQVDTTGIQGARLGEKYGGKPAARFQFVVEEGGGIVLLSRLNRAFAEYFNDHPDARKVFWGWKIFGEQASKGRSDSCVVYLNRTFRDPRVTRVWEKYILDNPDLARSVNTSFRASGLYDMGQGAWGLDLPQRGLFMEQCAASRYNESAGLIVGSVLGQGYALAVDYLVHNPNDPLTAKTLQHMAQQVVGILVARVWPGSMPPGPAVVAHPP